MTDKFNYPRGPTHLIGTGIRQNKETEAKFDHYFRVDQDFDPIEADLTLNPGGEPIGERIRVRGRSANGASRLRRQMRRQMERSGVTKRWSRARMGP